MIQIIYRGYLSDEQIKIMIYFWVRDGFEVEIVWDEDEKQILVKKESF